MNLTSEKLASLDLTTLQRAKAMANVTVDNGNADGLIARFITDVSAEVTEYLGFHTLRAERTETYEIQVGRRRFTLDGRPVDLAQTFELRLGTSWLDADLDALAVEAGTNFRVTVATGEVLLRDTSYASPMFARVTYTGGLGATTDAIVTGWPAISTAVDRQIKHHMQRLPSLGGSISILGSGTAFTREYGLLDEVKRVLDGYRRHAA